MNDIMPLGCELKCILSGFKGILVNVEYHINGCTRYTLLPEGTEDLNKMYSVSKSYVEKISDGVLKELPYMPTLSPKFKLGDKVKTVMGCEGVITIIQHTIQGSLRYFIATDKKDADNCFIAFEPTMKLA